MLEERKSNKRKRGKEQSAEGVRKDGTATVS